MCDYVIVCVHIKCATSIVFVNLLPVLVHKLPCIHAVVRGSLIIRSRDLVVVRTTAWCQPVGYGSNKPATKDARTVRLQAA